MDNNFTFALPTLHAQVDATSLTALVAFISDRNDYALYEVTSDGVDTVGVCP